MNQDCVKTIANYNDEIVNTAIALANLLKSREKVFNTEYSNEIPEFIPTYNLSSDNEINEAIGLFSQGLNMTPGSY